jgi:hypothetical protein
MDEVPTLRYDLSDGKQRRKMNPRMLFVSVIVAIGSSVTYAAPFELPPLPYGYEALEPFIGKTTLMTHHLKHHAK